MICEALEFSGERVETKSIKHAWRCALPHRALSLLGLLYKSEGQRLER